MTPKVKTMRKNKLSEASFILILSILFILTPKGNQSHFLPIYLSLMFFIIYTYIYVTHLMHFFACYFFFQGNY